MSIFLPTGTITVLRNSGGRKALLNVMDTVTISPPPSRDIPRDNGTMPACTSSLAESVAEVSFLYGSYIVSNEMLARIRS